MIGALKVIAVAFMFLFTYNKHKYKVFKKVNFPDKITLCSHKWTPKSTRLLTYQILNQTLYKCYKTKESESR